MTVVMPEFVLPRWYQRPLHNQTALLVKGALIFERGVFGTSVPHHTHTPEARTPEPTQA